GRLRGRTGAGAAARPGRGGAVRVGHRRARSGRAPAAGRRPVAQGRPGRAGTAAGAVDGRGRRPGLSRRGRSVFPRLRENGRHGSFPRSGVGEAVPLPPRAGEEWEAVPLPPLAGAGRDGDSLEGRRIRPACWRDGGCPHPSPPPQAGEGVRQPHRRAARLQPSPASGGGSALATPPGSETPALPRARGREPLPACVGAATGQPPRPARRCLRICASTAAIAVMFTTRRGREAVVSTWAGLLTPIRIGPRATPSVITRTML